MTDHIQIVVNRIRTPDGTVLQSYNRHDYVTHVDKNGKEYMVDGGNDYLRRNVHDDAPAEEMSLSMDDPFDQIREAFCWGTRGVAGDEPLKWVPLMKLSSDHIEAILDNGYGADWVRTLMSKELEFRK